MSVVAVFTMVSLFPSVHSIFSTRCLLAFWTYLHCFSRCGWFGFCYFYQIYGDLTMPKIVTISIGAATYIAEETPDDLVKKADKALYSAKKQGCNRIVFYSKAFYLDS